MNARVIFSEDFLNKTKGTLSKREVGRLRLERLKALDESGELQRAKSRREVAELVLGEDFDVQQGQHWVFMAIKRGWLEEIPRGCDQLYGIVNEYHYKPVELPSKSKAVRLGQIENPVVHNAQKSDVTVTLDLSIKRGSTEIKVSSSDVKTQSIGEILEKLLKGEL